MGIGNFFDNFMGGLAFGMLANLSFGRWGGGYCCNSFPMMGGFGYQNNDFSYMFDNSFYNSFPQINFSAVMPSIWDFAKESTDNYFKQASSGSCCTSVQLNGCNQAIPMYDMPFSGYYFSNLQSPYFSRYTAIQQQTVTQVKPQETVKPAEPDAEPKKDNVQPVAETVVTPVAQQISPNDDLEPLTTDSERISPQEISYNAQELKTKWSRKKQLPDAFYERVVQIAKRIKCDPNDLMGVMWVESSHSFSPSAYNPHGGATGLIQFMPDTAVGLGTTTTKLSRMSAVEQLDYVEKHLINAKKMKFRDDETIDRGTLYALLFLPAYAKRDVLTRRGETYYNWNPKLDYNNDGKITKDDLANTITAHMA